MFFNVLANCFPSGDFACPSGREKHYEMSSGQIFFVFVWTNILYVCQNNICLSRQTFLVSGQTFLLIFSSYMFFSTTFLPNDLKKVLQSAPCHKDYIYILTLNIGTWETGQRIEQTDRQTDKPNYNIDIDIDFRLDRSYIEYVYDWLTVNSYKSITFID